jgi:endonuclease/exonuclease/phosphatase (EEP) superfamily protein YafD
MKLLFITGSRVLAGFMIILTLLALLLPFVRATSALDDYMIHLMFGMIAIGIAGLFTNDRVVMFSGLICAGTLAMYLKNASNLMLKFPKANEQTTLHIAHINLSFAGKPEDLVKILEDHSIDVISFQEFTPEWSYILPDLLSDSFPFALQYPRVDLYGKAIFSRYQIFDESIIFLNGSPNLDFSLNKNGFKFNIYSVYLTPALDKISRIKSAQELESLENILRKVTENKIVIGELNQVYWSGEIMKFRRTSGLLNSRRDIMPYKNKIPYDHIFHSGDLECFSFSELEDTEGYHIGCKAKFQIKKTKNQEK